MRADPHRPTVTVRNDYGEWVPSIPVPFFLPFHRHQCGCGRWFWTMGGYRGHFALVHAMGLR